MQNLFPFIIIAVVAYLIFFRKGGMGCCGGHSNHRSTQHQDVHPEKSSNDKVEKVIDLGADEYKIMSSEMLGTPDDIRIDRKIDR
jgi:hypothetical protein